MQRWEYATSVVYFDKEWRVGKFSWGTGPEAETIYEALSAMGEDGWELVATLAHGERAQLLFKRPKQE